MTDSAPAPPTEPPSLSAAALKERIDAGETVRLLDVRDRDEYDQWRIDGPTVQSAQVPFTSVLQAKVRGTAESLLADLPGEGPVVTVCAEGEASEFAAGLLRAHGVDARNLADGMAGWARLYEAVELPCDEATVVQFQRPATGCLSYLVVADGEAAVVDPLSAFTDRYLAVVAEHGATLRYAVDTHVHADHVSGLRELAAEGARAVLPARADARGVTFEASIVEDGESIALGETSMTALALPGHTTEMTGFNVGDVLLTGDSLFLESVARPDLEAGAEGARDLARELYRTLHERLEVLPDETLVAPGHYSSTATRGPEGAFTASLGDLRARLDAFERSEAEFVDAVAGAASPHPANFERIVAINLGTADADAETAFELELGPNNCAIPPSGGD